MKHRAFLPSLSIGLSLLGLVACGDRELIDTAPQGGAGGESTGGSTDGGAGNNQSGGSGNNGGNGAAGNAGGGGSGGEANLDVDMVDAQVQATNALRIDVDIETTVAAETYIVFQPTDARLGQAPQTTRKSPEGTEHTITLYGMLPDTEYTAQVFAETGEGDQAFSDPFTVTTDALPQEIPSGLTVDIDTSSFNGYVMSMPLFQGPYLLIYDMQGRIVWYEIVAFGSGINFHNVLPSGRIATYSREQLYLYDLSGEVLLTLDRTGQDRLFHHDVAELPNGDIALFTSSIGTGVNAGFIGDGIDVINSNTGDVLWQWDFFDHFNVNDWTSITGNFWQDFLAGTGFSHGNSLQIDENGDYFMSFHHMNLLAKVDGTTGDVVWTLGQQSDDFVLPPEMSFATQHAFFPQGNDTFSLFNNGNGTTIPTSVGLEFTVDEVSGSVEVTWSFDTGEFCTITSAVFHLENGNRMVTCGPQARFWEVDEDGNVLYDARMTDPGNLTYRFTPMERLNPLPTFTL